MKYSVETIIEKGKVLGREDFVFFWGHIARAEMQMKACLSQWFPCGFLVEGIYYNCAEQFMMAEKARLFHDEDTLQKIMQTYDPMEQKKMGRRVQGYDDAQWKEHCFDIVVRGNVAKFLKMRSCVIFLFLLVARYWWKQVQKTMFGESDLTKNHLMLSIPKGSQEQTCLVSHSRK